MRSTMPVHLALLACLAAPAAACAPVTAGPDAPDTPIDAPTGAPPRRPDCEVALREAVAAWQTVIDRELGTGTLTLSLVARWTAPQQIEPNMRIGQSNNNNNNSNNNHHHQHNERDQSTTYGTTSATRSQGPTIDDENWFPAPHWKNQITGPPERGRLLVEHDAFVHVISVMHGHRRSAYWQRLL